MRGYSTKSNSATLFPLALFLDSFLFLLSYASFLSSKLLRSFSIHSYRSSLRVALPVEAASMAAAAETVATGLWSFFSLLLLSLLTALFAVDGVDQVFLDDESWKERQRGTIGVCRCVEIRTGKYFLQSSTMWEDHSYYRRKSEDALGCQMDKANWTCATVTTCKKKRCL